MTCRWPLVAAFLFLACLASPLSAYIASSDRGYTFEVTVTGPKEINIYDPGWTTATYQGEGLVTITITATYAPAAGEPFDGTVGLVVRDSNNHATFTYDYAWASTTATATVDLGATNLRYLQLWLSGGGSVNSDPISSGFYTTIFLYKERVFALQSGDTEGKLWIVGRSPLTAWLRQIKLTPASNYYGCTEEVTSVAGETVTPVSTAYVVDPPSATTDENGAVAFNFYPLDSSSGGAGGSPSQPLGGSTASQSDAGERRNRWLAPENHSWASSSCSGTSVPTAEVSIEAGSGQKAPRTVVVPYARIAEMYGDVRVKGSLSGEWRTASSGCSLGYGDIIFLGPMDARSYQVPSVSLEFYDRSLGTVDGYYTKEASNLLIKLGDHVETQEYTMLNDVRNLAYEVYANPREWAKSAVTQGIGTGVKWATGGWGWIASTAAGQIVKYGIGKVDDWVRPNARAPIRPVTQADGPSMPTPPLLDSRVAATMAPASEYASDVFTSYRADGTADIINRGQARILTDGTTNVFVPPWSTVSVDLRNAGPPSAAVPMVVSPYLEKPTLTITPANDATVTTLQPKITFDYSGSVPMMPSTFVARLNGFLVSPLMRAGTTATTWTPPKERPLVRGQNLITASIRTIAGATSRNSSRVTADMPLPSPTAPRTYPGRSLVILSWDAIRDPAIVGYKVFRSTTADGTPVEIFNGTLAQTAFADTPPAGAASHYRIAGVTAAGERTELSTSTPATLNPRASRAAPPALTSVSAVASDGRVTLSFSRAPLSTIAVKVERQAGGTGAFTNVVSNGGLVVRSPFIDSSAANGTPYVYRITPLGFDLVAGPATVTSSVLPLDAAPVPPEGVTVEIDFGGARVEWNPSPEPDLRGYHVERARVGGSFVRLNTSPATEASYFDSSLPAGLYAYRVIAVDGTSHESAPSALATEYVRGSATVTTPTNVVATATGSTNVEISWSMVEGATSYAVERRAPGGDYQVVGRPSDHRFTDGAALPGTAYLYRVQASGTGVSAFSLPDLATTFVFTDSPLRAGMTIRASHLSQLRAAVNAVRSLGRLDAYPFTDSASAGVWVRAAHVTQLRTALEEAFSALGLSGTSYVDASLSGVPAKAMHFQQLRDRLQ